MVIDADAGAVPSGASSSAPDAAAGDACASDADKCAIFDWKAAI
jgi:hypothetical protein